MKLYLMSLAVAAILLIEITCVSSGDGEPQVSQKMSMTQQLPDGTCVRKTMELVDGESSEVTEQVDCQEVQEEQQRNAQKVEDDVYQIQQEIEEQMN